MGWAESVWRAVDSWLSAHNPELVSAAALATMGGAVATVVLAIFAVRALRSQERIARRQEHLATLWKLREHWNESVERGLADRAFRFAGAGSASPPGFLKQRLRSLFPDRASRDDLLALLNFFEEMAFLANRGHIDDEMTWNSFYGYVQDLWESDGCRAFVRATKQEDPPALIEIGPWMARLAALEARKNGSASKPKPPTALGWLREWLP